MNKKTIILTVMTTIIAGGAVYADEGAQKDAIEKVLVEKEISTDQELVDEIFLNLAKVKSRVAISEKVLVMANEGCLTMWQCLQEISRDLDRIADDSTFEAKRQKVVSELLEAKVLELKVEAQELKVVLSDDLIERLRAVGVIASGVKHGGGILCF